MAIGSVYLGRTADRMGRRPTILVCLLIMASGMLLATTSATAVQLAGWRIITGIGIGGMLSTTNAVAAEFSNGKRRAVCISMMVVGYPFGGIVCGEVGKALLDATASNWREIFVVGSVLSATLIPLVYLAVPESVHWLARRQPSHALERTNRVLARLGHASVQSLPPVPPEKGKQSLAALFSTTLAASTVLITLVYFFHMTTFYYVLKWTPTIVTSMGIPAAAAAGVLSWANVCGALGGVVFGLLVTRFGMKALTTTILLLTAVTVVLFGRSPPEVVVLSWFVALAGFCGNAGVSGLYTIIARVFPTHLRASGTGFAIGVGRCGAIVAPAIAGYLMQRGIDSGAVLADVLASTATIMALGSFIAAILLLFLRLRDGSRL